MDKGGSEAEKEQKMRERDTRVAWNIRKENSTKIGTVAWVGYRWAREGTRRKKKKQHGFPHGSTSGSAARRH